MAAYGLLTMYNLTASIGVSQGSDPPGTWTYAELAEGFDNIAEALNEVVQQYFFLSDKGFAKNHVTGMAPAFTLTGITFSVRNTDWIPTGSLLSS